MLHLLHSSTSYLWILHLIFSLLILFGSLNDISFCLSSIQVVQTALSTGDRLSHKPSISWTTKNFTTNLTVVIDPDIKYQQILGFGGAFTESAAYVWSQLNPSLQKEVIDAYFGPNGHHYTVCRTHINSCDFSLASFSFDDTVNDFTLQNFTVEHSNKWMFPFMKAAINASQVPLKIFASPWSPPAWMKRNGQMNGSSRPCLKSDISFHKSYHAAWALFFSKFISAYNERGFKIWGITIQNEPEFNAPWEACCYTPNEELDFLRQYLGPQLRRDHPDVKIMIYDHNKDHIVDWVRTIYSDPVGYSFADGTAFHWYTGPQFEHLAAAHSLFPDKFLLATEATNEGPPTFGTAGWLKAEAYAYDILGDLNNWAVGWVDWNMILDTQGGPNHLNNFCDAPLIADIENQKLHYQIMYYYLGQITRFVLPNSVHIASEVSGLDIQDKTFSVSAFQTPDNRIVVVILNRSDQEKTVKLTHGENFALVTSIPHSIQTLYYKILD